MANFEQKQKQEQKQEQNNNLAINNNYLENKISKTKQDNSINEKDIIVKVIGIGGLGGKIVQGIIQKGLTKQIEYIAINTDKNELANLNLIDRKYLIGENLTNGNGTGGNREFGESAATEFEKESKEKIFELSKNQFVFLIAGMGGGTGSGATPIIAKIAKEFKASSLSMLFIPRTFEGNKVQNLAQTSSKEVRYYSPILKYHMDKIINLCDEKKDLQNCLTEISYKLLELIYLTLHYIGSPNLDFNKFLNVIGNENCFFDYLEIKNEVDTNKIMKKLSNTINNLNLKELSDKKFFLEIHHNYLNNKEETLLMENISKDLGDNNNELFWGLNKEKADNDEEKFLNIYFLISGNNKKEKSEEKTNEIKNPNNKVEDSFTL